MWAGVCLLPETVRLLGLELPLSVVGLSIVLVDSTLLNSTSTPSRRSSRASSDVGHYGKKRWMKRVWSSSLPRPQLDDSTVVTVVVTLLFVAVSLWRCAEDGGLPPFGSIVSSIGDWSDGEDAGALTVSAMDRSHVPTVKRFATPVRRPQFDFSVAPGSGVAHGYRYGVALYVVLCHVGVE